MSGACIVCAKECPPGKALCGRECSLARKRETKRRAIPPLPPAPPREAVCRVCGVRFLGSASGRPPTVCGAKCRGKQDRGEVPIRSGAVPGPKVEDWLAEQRPAWAREERPRADAWAGCSSLGLAEEATW